MLRTRYIFLFLLLTFLPTGCQSNVVNRKIEDAREVAEMSESPNSPTQRELDAVRQPCGDEQTAAAMEQCVQKEFEASDAELNGLYEKITANLQKAEAQAAQQKDKNLTHNYKKDSENLKNAQKTWLAYREANCAAEQETFDDADGSRASFFSCRQRLNEQRADELKFIYQFINENK